MKKYCFNYLDCGWVEYIPKEELEYIDYKNTFIICPECKSIAAIVRNEFTLERFEIETVTDKDKTK